MREGYIEDPTLRLPDQEQSPNYVPGSDLLVEDVVRQAQLLARPLSLPPLVGMIGKKRAGKDTFAAELLDWFGYRRVAFADPLRNTLLDLDPWIAETNRLGGHARTRRLSWIVEELGWELAKEEIPEVRRLMQAHGHAIRTHVDPTVWLSAAMAKAQVLRADGEPVVITDCRYQNEADAIKAAGGVLVRVVRPGQADGDRHITEVDLDERETDYVVQNDGTLEDLRRQARLVAEWILN